MTPNPDPKAPDLSQAPLEFFLVPVSDTIAARVPFPFTLPIAARDAYMANPPADVLAAAERVPHDSRPAPSTDEE